MKKIFLIVALAMSLSGVNIIAQSSITYTKSGHGKPVIFLPALSCNGSVWNSAVNELNKKFTCYEISIAGFGKSPLKGNFSLERISKDLIKLINEEKLQHPVLIGHSVSGFLALKTASENPGVFSKLIIVDSYPFAMASINPAVTVEQAQQQAAMIRNMYLKQTDDEFRKTEEMILPTLISNKENIDTVLNWMTASNRNAIAEATYEMASTDLRNELKKIDCKTLVIGTWKGKEQFGFTKESAEKILNEQYKNLKDKKIIISDNSKHFIMLDTPGWLNKQITGFISE